MIPSPQQSSRSLKLISLDMGSPDSWSLTMDHSLRQVNLEPSPRAGVSNALPRHLTTAKPMAKLNQP